LLYVISDVGYIHNRYLAISLDALSSPTVLRAFLNCSTEFPIPMWAGVFGVVAISRARNPCG